MLNVPVINGRKRVFSGHYSPFRAPCVEDQNCLETGRRGGQNCPIPNITEHSVTFSSFVSFCSIRRVSDLICTPLFSTFLLFPSLSVSFLHIPGQIWTADSPISINSVISVRFSSSRQFLTFLSFLWCSLGRGRPVCATFSPLPPPFCPFLPSFSPRF